VRPPKPGTEDVPVLTMMVKRVLDNRTCEAVRAQLHFDPGVPMVVTLHLEPPRGPGVIWRISRSLLYQGLFEHSGDGDAQVWPAPGGRGGTALLQLTSRQASALLELPVPRLARWLELTYEIVPVETEADLLDWSGFLLELLADPGRTAPS
jgi:hypothetical protein